MRRHGGHHRRRQPRRRRRLPRRLARWALGLLAGQLGSAACHAAGLTAAFIRLARWGLATLGF